MELTELDRVMTRITAVFPMPDTALVEWRQELRSCEFNQADEAATDMRRALKKRPYIADFFEHYHALDDKYRSKGRRLPGKPRCGMCDEMGRVPSRCNTQSGSCDCAAEWSINGNVCPRGYSTTTRCPNGCGPMTRDQRGEWEREQDALTDRERKARAARGDGPPRFDRPLERVVHRSDELAEEPF